MSGHVVGDVRCPRAGAHQPARSQKPVPEQTPHNSGWATNGAHRSGAGGGRDRRGSCQSVGMPEDHFDGRAAERYDATEADMFASAAVQPAVEFLADQAGGGAALELGTVPAASPFR